MSHSGKTRYAHSRYVSPSPLSSPYPHGRSVSRSLSRSRSRSRSRDSIDAENPGNNLYVTGLSSRITERELEKHFETEGKVVDAHLVVDRWTKESRGFGFVTMSTIKEADRCIKYLDRSVLEGRVITVEKAKRRRGRTPTPGRYLGLHTRDFSSLGRHHSASYSDRSCSPYYRRQAYSPYYRRYRSRSRSPYDPSRRRRSYSRDFSDYSPERSVSPNYSRRYGRRYASRSVSPRRYRRGYSRSYSPRSQGDRRNYSRSYSPRDRRSRRSYSRSYSPSVRRYRSRSSSYSRSPRPIKLRSRESYAHSRSNSCSINSR
ncbi:serine/arginine-rich splicing factor SR45a-like isoform X2 [Zingiber officinale]|uniref:serine/arginine-rich splicing factor SR45a-like isoform X2 n=1 Tax=Zingiber officinale TaxID=94328 RepID=UPI001C4B6DC5|nr:serine/arginine-rich splicing factor SR45a-like isoform X2 [Zingiber officinale]